jgi:alpha-L-rhamnosidase
MQSERYGAMQTAYQVLASDSPEALTAGRYIFDSGKVSASNSAGIEYQGSILKPTTRYYWKVKVWDERDSLNESTEPAWFETGLLGGDWKGARWIGSSKPPLSKYRSHYVIDFDVQIPEGNNRAGFVFGARDEKHFVSVDIDLDRQGKAHFSLSHTTGGETTADALEDVSAMIHTGNKHAKHHVRLDVTTSQYALKYFVDVSIDGVELIDASLPPEELKRKQTPNGQGMFVIYPYPKGDLVYLCRLYNIGFKQPEGETAVFSGITISEKTWNTTLYHSEKTYTEKGTNRLNVWYPGEGASAPMLRKAVKIEKPVKKARLYATARGIYEFSINGRKVGADYFNPGWTDYRYRFMYNTYDVTSLLRQGDNGIGALLGTGWWSDHSGFLTSWQDQYGTQESLLALLQIEYADGTKESIVTDNTWKRYDDGPIVMNSLQNGEEYDARKEVAGWDAPGFDDAAWKPAVQFQPPPASVKIQSYVGSAVQNHIILTAQSVVEALPGVYVYDMGQNMTGVPRLTMKGKAGSEILIRFGEMNYPETIPADPVAPYTIETYKQKKGQVYTDNYRSALSTDRYIMKGDPLGETCEPRFTFHGYRYVEIHGLDKPLPLKDVKGIVLESIGSPTSSYASSNEHINRLYENILWGQRGNFLSVPTDCPQRDERMGWTGDAQVFARTATYNMNVDPFYTRWLYSVRDNQGADGRYANYVPLVGVPPHGADGGEGAMGWMEAGIIVPWQMYQQYADRRILEQQYASMTAYMDYLERAASDYVQPSGGFGDWLAMEGTHTMLTNTAYSACDALIMEQVAGVLGKEADRKRFRIFYENIKTSFNKYFVDDEGYTCVPDPETIFGRNGGDWQPGGSSSGSKRVDTQTSYVVPLQFGLFNPKNQPLAIKRLVNNIEEHNYTLTTGFIGTPYLNLVLSDSGYDDVAYKLFEQTDYPSWLYPVLQGATTIWERWNSYTLRNGFGPVDMNSFNHYSYGAVQEWMMAYTLGIQRDEASPGYKNIILQPRMGGSFAFIQGHYDSVYGRIESGWEKTGNGYTYKATIPANTTAILILPTANTGKVTIEQGKEAARYRGVSENKVMYTLASGKYLFRVEM